MLHNATRGAIAFGLLFALVWIMPTVFAQDATGNSNSAEAFWHAQARFRPVQGLMQIYLRVAGVVWIVAEWIAALVLIRAYKLVALNFSLDKGDPK